MAVNLVVRAEVIDVREDIPKETDAFFVDTNVWFWLTYSRASLSKDGPTDSQKHYPEYIKRCLDINSSLYRCELSAAEILHCIESCEFNIFKHTNHCYNLKKKEFRHNYPTLRKEVVEQTDVAWRQVKDIASCTDLSMNEHTSQIVIEKAGEQLLDGYDFFILEAMLKAGINKIVTDDLDFVTVPNISVFTSNASSLAAAREQGKLASRYTTTNC
jgi:predicted nucleic acid-binding protein